MSFRVPPFVCMYVLACVRTGAGFAAIYDDMMTLHGEAYPAHTDATPMLRSPGQVGE